MTNKEKAKVLEIVKEAMWNLEARDTGTRYADYTVEGKEDMLKEVEEKLNEL